MKNSELIDTFTECLQAIDTAYEATGFVKLAKSSEQRMKIEAVIASLKDDSGCARSAHQQRVDGFMKLAGQDLPAYPEMPSEEVRWLRARLILEEAFETAAALGFTPCQCLWHDKGETRAQPFMLKINDAPEEHTEMVMDFSIVEPDLVEIIDGCCDIKVVTTGTLSACGVPDEPFQEEVDENNLAKFAPGGHRDEHGKWLKPPGHKPPRITELLARIHLGEASVKHERSIK